MVADYRKFVNFIVLHYSATARDDSPSGYGARTSLPIHLQERIELFKGHGALREGVR